MKKILGVLLAMMLVLTACGAKEEQPQVDPAKDGDQTTEETTVQWYENGEDAILVNEGVISFDLKDQYFDAAIQAGEGVSTVVYNGKAYVVFEVVDDKLITYEVPGEDEEVDKSTATEYTKVDRDYTTKDVNGPELSSIKKAFEDSKVVKAKKVIAAEETFVVTIENNETKEVTDVTLDKEFNVK